ncbi:MAG TPA: PAS domain-containing protein [Bryobacteraceae bacterium]
MDLTGAALRQRLHELESLFELLPVGVAIVRDREGREMVTNAAFCRMIGVSPEINPSKTGPNADKLPFKVVENGVEIPPQDLPLQRTARDGVSIESLCHIIRDDGKTVALQGRIVPLLDTDGKPCGSLGVFVDVTERENLICELQEAHETIRTLTGMLAICAHCKRIRDTNDRWVQFEAYIRDHSNAEFTHSICPSCAAKHWERKTPG